MTKKEKSFKKQFRKFEKTYKDFEKMIKFVEEQEKQDRKKPCRSATEKAVQHAGVAKQYEFLVEMSWKAMYTLLKAKRVPVDRYPHEVIKKAAVKKIIASKADTNEWLSAVRKRNRSVHTYNTKFPQAVAKYAKDVFHPLAGALRLRLKEEL